MTMSQKKILLTIAAVFCLVIGSVLFMQIKRSPQDADTFTVGMTAGYAPFVSIDANGEYVGFDIDVAKALAAQMDKKLVLKDLGSMAGLFMALEQGTIDAIIWAMSITQDRLKKVDMVRYAGETTTAYQLLFWQSVPANIRSLEDMAGKTVCVEPASAQDVVISKYPDINKLATEKVDDALLYIQYGKADAVFVELAIAKKFKNKYPEIQVVDIPLAAEDQVMGMGITLKKGNVERVKAIQKAVDQLRSQGIINNLETRWDIS
jgi:ABC-type amino acid transport substrate-binding protein